MLRDVRAIRIYPVVEVFERVWSQASDATTGQQTGPDSLVPPSFGTAALLRCNEVAREAIGPPSPASVDPSGRLVRTPFPRIWSQEERLAWNQRPPAEQAQDLNIWPTISIRDAMGPASSPRQGRSLIVVNYATRWQRSSTVPSEAWTRGDAFALLVERREVPSLMLTVLETLTRQAVAPLRGEPPLPSRA
ncbi:hypothetical protein [Roseomonas fluvialis]|uniref:Uncharacterized protein n=1 Tax=Roseomonas fluvialis TaxID=1750527 RepID=A0ABM7Y2Y6_9PROT|nr:hypothetical protein [Roseomonas fluvialis]BDG72219.1 hypothetical protein Rmf_21480 [Roseomonas fluvialis]